jgi:succinate-acetate transporter protein
MADSVQDSEGTETPPAGDLDLSELNLKERIVLATAQQPALGLFLVLFSLFAFTFFIALALVYPTVAGLFILVTLVVALLGAGGFFVLRRLDRL